MSELRFNHVTGDWVIIASERGKRPDDYIIRMNRREVPSHVSTCPFCVGNEGMANLVFAEPSSGAWAVRVVRNRLPALRPDLENGLAGEVMTHRMTGFGYHELLIENPEHNRYLFDQSPSEVEQVLAALKRRYVEIGSDGRISLVVIFKNHGFGAGSSLDHPHCQIL